MKSAAQLMKNTLVLAASTIFLRLCTLCFQSYLARRIGSEQLGVFGIISSVGVVFATVSISGVRFGVTRLVAEEISLHNAHPRALMRCAFLYAAVFGVASGAVLFFAAPFFASHWVLNENAVLPLKIMAPAMPIIALGSCVQGYFTAKQKVARMVISEISSQLLRVAFVVMCFETGEEAKNTADILSAGFFVGEGALGALLLGLYICDTRKKSIGTGKNYFPALFKMAFPLAVSAYMRTGLSSLGQIIIPQGLKKAGMGSKSAFASYGVITQMSLPVIMFPAAFLGAMGQILVPRLTSAQVEKQKIGISYMVNRSLRIGSLFSFAVAGIMLFYSKELGEVIYKSSEAGLYIKVFAPLVPVMYIDSVTDGCLKGLGQQIPCMIYNVMEGILNVTLLFFLLPKMAIEGFIVVMYIKEVFNTVLSLRRLAGVTAIDGRVMPFLSMCAAMWGAYLCEKIVGGALPLALRITLYCVFYASVLYVFSGVSRDDLKWIATLFRIDTKRSENS